jgi:hypothetical protein
MRLRSVLLVPAVFALGYLAYAVVYTLYSWPPLGRWSIATSFEPGEPRLDGFGMRQVCCAHSAQIVTGSARQGRHALRMRLDAADPLVRASYRAEIRFPSTWRGSENDYAFSVFVPSDWVDDTTFTVAQWHGVPDRWLGEAHQPPPLELLLGRGQWVLSCAWDARPVIGTLFLHRQPRHHDHPLRIPIERGRWVDWAFHVRWACDRTGVLSVSKDGVEVWRRSGPNAYNDAIGPYFKFGVYEIDWLHRHPTVSSRRLDFDAIRVDQGVGAPGHHHSSNPRSEPSGR